MDEKKEVKVIGFGAMRFPIIKVKDKMTGYERIVGASSHDMLVVEGNLLSYLNIQNMESSGDDGTYEFQGVEDEIFGLQIEFVTFEELQEIYQQEEAKKNKAKALMEESVAKYFSDIE